MDLTTYARNKNCMTLPGYNRYWDLNKTSVGTVDISRSRC